MLEKGLVSRLLLIERGDEPKGYRLRSTNATAACMT